MQIHGEIQAPQRLAAEQRDEKHRNGKREEVAEGCAVYCLPSDDDATTAEKETFLATAAVPITSQDAPEWIELIPAGQFDAVDGRGPFTNEDPQRIIAESVAKMPQAGLVLDYDHSTDLAAPEGRPAPAAGWLKDFQVERGAIFARVEWTAEAAQAVKAKKYRYVSPVFEHDRDGCIERILRAALTNNPALIDLPAIASAQPAELTERKRTRNESRRRMMASKENSLSEIVRGLEELFPQMSKPHILKMAMGSLADESESSSEGDRDESMAAGDDPYEHEDAEEMAQRHQDEMKHCTSDEARAEMERRHELERERFAKRIRGLEVESRQSVSGKPLSIEQFQAAVARHPMVVQMASELNQLRAAQARKAAEAAVDSAIRGGRLVPSQRDWAVEYCSSEPRGFHKFIGAQPQILQSGPDGTFTGRIGEAPADALTRKELAVCETLGIGADQFAVAKKVRLSHNVHLGD